MRIKQVVSASLMMFLAASYVSAQPVETVFTSIAEHDGWVYEATEDSGVGDVRSNSDEGGKGLRIGDYIRDRQLVSIVSFDTAPLPDCAEIVSARLELTRNGNGGSNPFNILGDMLVDVHKGEIGGNASLQGNDFQAEVDYPSAAVTGDQGGNLSLYEIDIDPSMLNVEGLTQMRLRFEKPDNDDAREDYAGYYSANNESVSRHPRLVVSFTCSCESEPTDTSTDTGTATDTSTGTDTGM